MAHFTSKSRLLLQFDRLGERDIGCRATRWMGSTSTSTARSMYVILPLPGVLDVHRNTDLWTLWGSLEILRHWIVTLLVWLCRHPTVSMIIFSVSLQAKFCRKYATTYITFKNLKGGIVVWVLTLLLLTFVSVCWGISPRCNVIDRVRFMELSWALQRARDQSYTIC